MEMTAKAGGDFVEGKDGRPHRATNIMISNGELELPVEIHVYGTKTYIFPHGDVNKAHDVGDFHLDRGAIEVRPTRGIPATIPGGIYSIVATKNAEGNAVKKVQRTLKKNQHTPRRR